METVMASRPCARGRPGERKSSKSPLAAANLPPCPPTASQDRARGEQSQANRVRVSLANPAELLELPGIGLEQARAILEFRAECLSTEDVQRSLLVSITRATTINDFAWL